MKFIKILLSLCVFGVFFAPDLSFGDDSYCIYSAAIRVSSGSRSGGATSTSRTTIYRCITKTDTEIPADFINCYFDGTQSEENCKSCVGKNKYYDSANSQCLSCPTDQEGRSFESKTSDVAYGIESCRVSGVSAQTEEGRGCKATYRYSIETWKYEAESSLTATKNYYINSNNECKKCPENAPYSEGGQIGLSSCHTCVAGWCMNDGFCYECSAGYSCSGNANGTAKACTYASPEDINPKDAKYYIEECGIDQYSSKGSAVCSDCADGYTTYNSASGLCDDNHKHCTSAKACVLKTARFCFGPALQCGNGNFSWPTTGITQGAMDISKAVKIE